MTYRYAISDIAVRRAPVVASGSRNRIGTVLGAVLVATLTALPALYAQVPAAGPKQTIAERVMDGDIRVDGTLDEPIWHTARAVTDFVQAEPDEGAAPSDRMEVRFAYDDSALYVGARMFSTGAIQAPLSRRDDGGQSESIHIELDTYYDRRTAYMFGVTAAGVRLDHYHPRDEQNDRDLDYEPVWQARTHGRHRRRVDGRARAAVLATAVQRAGRACLRPEHQAGRAGTQRGRLLGVRAPDRKRLGVTVR